MFEAERNLEILQDEQIDEDERAEFASDKNDPSRNAASEIFSMKQRLEREKFKKDPVHLAESKIKVEIYSLILFSIGNTQFFGYTCIRERTQRIGGGSPSPTCNETHRQTFTYAFVLYIYIYII